MALAHLGPVAGPVAVCTRRYPSSAGPIAFAMCCGDALATDRRLDRTRPPMCRPRTPPVRRLSAAARSNRDTRGGAAHALPLAAWQQSPAPSERPPETHQSDCPSQLPGTAGRCTAENGRHGYAVRYLRCCARSPAAAANSAAVGLSALSPKPHDRSTVRRYLGRRRYRCPRRRSRRAGRPCPLASWRCAAPTESPLTVRRMSCDRDLLRLA